MVLNKDRAWQIIILTSLLYFYLKPLPVRSRPILFLILILSIVLVPVAVYFQLSLYNGTIGASDLAWFALVVLGSFGIVYAATFLFFPEKYEATPIMFNYFFMRTAILASVILVGSNMVTMNNQINELESNPTFTRGIVVDAQEKGKKHEPWKIFSFTYNGKDYSGEFRDPFLRLFVGDSVTVKHSAEHPQYNYAVVDTIYDNNRK